jgi:hypothetical protein
MRLTTPQEIRFERPVERREATERPRVQPLSGTTQRPSHSFAESLRSCAPGQPIRTGVPGSKKRFLYKIFFERVRSCTTLVRYRKSTLGLGYIRSSASEVLCQQVRRRDQLLALRANNRELSEASLVSDAGTLLLHLSRVARLNAGRRHHLHEHRRCFRQSPPPAGQPQPLGFFINIPEHVGLGE